MKTDSRSFVLRLLNGLQVANDAAVAADVRVKRERARLRRYCQEHKYDEGSARAKFKGDYDLNDALDDYRRHVTEVERISAVVQAYVAGAVFLASPTDV